MHGNKGASCAASCQRSVLLGIPNKVALKHKTDSCHGCDAFQSKNIKANGTMVQELERDKQQFHSRKQSNPDPIKLPMTKIFCKYTTTASAISTGTIEVASTSPSPPAIAVLTPNYEVCSWQIQNDWQMYNQSSYKCTVFPKLQLPELWSMFPGNNASILLG